MNHTQQTSVYYAGFWIRAGALFVDSAVLWIISMVVGLGLTPLCRWGSLHAVQVRWWSNLWIIPNLLVSILYFAIMTKRYGGTLGKLAFGLQVISTDGGPLRWRQVILRESIGKWLSTLPLWFGFLRVVWAEKKQGLHDEMAGTAALIIKSSLYEYGKPGALERLIPPWEPVELPQPDGPVG